MIYIEPIKKIAKWQAKKLPELFTSLDKSSSTVQIFAVYKDDPFIKTKQGAFVGAMMVDFDNFFIRNGKPWFDIYIDKFEVAKGWRGNGIGRAMLHRLCWSYSIHKVFLCHVIKEKDGGASYRFWRHMGFHKENVHDQEMTKTIVKL